MVLILKGGDAKNGFQAWGKGRGVKEGNS